MRRVRYESPGGPLFVEEAPVPEPGPGELLVRTEAVGVTLPVVRKIAEAAAPVPLGGEIAGEVVAVGDGVTRFRSGDRVTGLCFGHGYADVAALHEAMASPIPDDASAVDAVALVRSGLVALGALEAARPAPGEAALVTAAASGVGQHPSENRPHRPARPRRDGRGTGPRPRPAPPRPFVSPHLARSPQRAASPPLANSPQPTRRSSSRCSSRLPRTPATPASGSPRS
ncbi:hypothetical protein GCM10027074_74680 [Streptomyces deserti]